MKTSILFTVLLLASVSSAQPSPTLNIDPDKIVQLNDIAAINRTCKVKHFKSVFQAVTGEACIDIPVKDLSLYIQNTEQKLKVAYSHMCRLANNNISSCVAVACTRSVPQKQDGAVNSLIVLDNPADYYNQPYMAYLHRYDSKMANPNAFFQYKITQIFANIIPDQIPLLIFNQNALRTKYDEFGDIAYTYYLAKDLIVSAPNNVSYFWRNVTTQKEIESLPLSRAEFISCIEDELAKLP